MITLQQAAKIISEDRSLGILRILDIKELPLYWYFNYEEIGQYGNGEDDLPIPGFGGLISVCKKDGKIALPFYPDVAHEFRKAKEIPREEWPTAALALSLAEKQSTPAPFPA